MKLLKTVALTDVSISPQILCTWFRITEVSDLCWSSWEESTSFSPSPGCLYIPSNWSICY